MAKTFSALEKNILKAKGLTDAQLKKLTKAGINSREDFKTVGDAATLAELVSGISKDVAAALIAWATGGPASGGGGGVVVESPDAVYCIHCRTKQPKDYNSPWSSTTRRRGGSPSRWGLNSSRRSSS